MNQIQATRQPTTETLLSTKLTVPRLRAPLVTRPALLARLDEGLDRKLTLISAPAGSGKTTLVSQWYLARQQDQSCQPRAWIALDAGDNDPMRFWRYLFSACQAFGPEIGKSALALLTMPQPAFEAALTEFINEMAQLMVVISWSWRIIISSSPPKFTKWYCFCSIICPNRSI